MKNKRLEVPMYFADGFVDGLEKAFPDGSTSHAEITEIKRQATTFLRQSGKKIRKIQELQKAIEDDPTQTPEGKNVNLWKQASKHIDKIQEQSENLPDISGFANHLESELDRTIEDKASDKFGMEARQRIASMDKKERGKFVSTALRNEDYKTSAYVLGAPAFLSGLPDKAHKELKKQYKKTVFKEEMQAVDALKSLDTHLQKGMKSAHKLKRTIHARARLNGALDKSEKTKELMK